MTATAADYQQLGELIDSGPHHEADSTTLRQHSQPKPGVHVAGRPQLCSTCGEPMPCRTIRRLAADYQFPQLMHATELGSVSAETGVVGPTGVTMRDDDEPDQP